MNQPQGYTYFSLLLSDTGHPKSVLCDNLKGWDGERGGRKVQGWCTTTALHWEELAFPTVLSDSQRQAATPSSPVLTSAGNMALTRQQGPSLLLVSFWLQDLCPSHPHNRENAPGRPDPSHTQNRNIKSPAVAWTLSLKFTFSNRSRHPLSSSLDLDLITSSSHSPAIITKSLTFFSFSFSFPLSSHSHWVFPLNWQLRCIHLFWLSSKLLLSAQCKPPNIYSAFVIFTP